MSKRLTFAEFHALHTQRKMPPELLVEYVEFDDERAVPRLVFRQDALLDSAPDDFDIDREIYEIERNARQVALETQDALSTVARTRVVAEGDSWFNLPAIIRPPAIADQLSNRRHLRVKNIAYWGHTLETILDEKEYLSELDTGTQFFIFSAGGNDIQNGLEDGRAVHEYDPDRPHDKYLTDDGEAILERIRDGHKAVYSAVIEKFPSVLTLTHGYDYPRPLVGKGKYIGKYLRRKGIPDQDMQMVIDPIIDKLNSAISEAASDSAAAKYLNCRFATKMFTWYDDMHPSKDGFQALADKFDDSIG